MEATFGVERTHIRSSNRARLGLLAAVLLVSTSYGISFPLLAIQLESQGIAPGLIGLNAAMPALGWLLGSPLLPWLHRFVSSQVLMLGFLLISALGVWGFASSDNFVWWLLCRFAFGGGLGMFFRVVEYWLNATTENLNRGRVLGIYSVCFLLGIAIGSVIQPEIGSEGTWGFICVALFLGLGAALVILIPLAVRSRVAARTPNMALGSVATLAPLALASVVAYGLFEDVPAYLLSIYTLKVGLSEDLAAYTLTAVVMGNLVFAIPLGAVSDRVGRMPILIGCALVGLIGAGLIPLLTGYPPAYLAFLVLWGGCIGGLYLTSLASIGDHFSDRDLISANALFGTVYAAAALIGPLINGGLMQLWDPQGLMVGCALIFGGFLLFVLVRRGRG